VMERPFASTTAILEMRVSHRPTLEDLSQSRCSRSEGRPPVSSYLVKNPVAKLVPDTPPYLTSKYSKMRDLHFSIFW
jgi:hypothetical protein